MSRVQNILVPWDFSNHSKAALRYACQHFPGDAIEVVCVLQPPNPYDPGFNWGPEAITKATQECEEQFRKEAGELIPDLAVNFRVEFGDAAEQLERVANQQQPDLIVISTHGRTGLQKLMLGSVAQQILKQSRFPVIVLPSRWFEYHSPDTVSNAQTGQTLA